MRNKRYTALTPFMHMALPQVALHHRLLRVQLKSRATRVVLAARVAITFWLTSVPQPKFFRERILFAYLPLRCVPNVMCFQRSSGGSPNRTDNLQCCRPWRLVLNSKSLLYGVKLRQHRAVVARGLGSLDDGQGVQLHGVVCRESHGEPRKARERGPFQEQALSDRVNLIIVADCSIDFHL